MERTRRRPSPGDAPDGTRPDPAAVEAPDGTRPEPADTPGGPATGPAPPALELLVHGVGGTTPEQMLDDGRTVRVTGDDTAAVYRRAADTDAETRPRAHDARPVPEAYVWCNLTSGDGSRALWLLLLPFMVVNLAHWMRPAAHRRPRTVRLYGLLVRLAGLTLTVLLVAAACEVALDLAAWQCAGTRACTSRHSWLGFLAPEAGGWWSEPGRRLALAALVPAALTGLLCYLSHRTWSAYESQQPPTPGDGPGELGGGTLARPGFWYGRRLVARLRAAHTAAGLLTVAAAVATPAAHFDRRPGGPAALDVLGWLLHAALLTTGAAAVAVVCRRGRSEHRPDRRLDRRLARRLPLGALLLLLLAVLYAGWSRPSWTSTGRLPGDASFGALSLTQGLLVVALAATARTLHRSRPAGHSPAGTPPGPRAALHGQGGPAVAMLACALGGVMSGGVAQRVADWLDGTGGRLPGPPVLLTWQASVIPVVLLLLLALAGRLTARTWRLARTERARVLRDFAGGPADRERTRRIARTRAMATLTDEGPLVVGVVSAATLALGTAALVGALGTGRTPVQAAGGAHPAVQGAAQTAQALGSWLVGLGFVLFVTWGRRAYKDASARRTIGILWDVGTFWPRAAHPFAPPCYAERAVPDLTWRMATWTRATGGRLVLSGHSQGSVLAAAAAWQLTPAVRARVALLTYGSPLTRLYGRWFPAHFGPDALTGLHRDVACWRNLYRLTDPIGGPVLLPRDDAGPDVDRAPLKDPLVHGRTARHPLPAPILGHSDYQADPAFAEERRRLLARLRPDLPAPRPAPGDAADPGSAPPDTGPGSEAPPPDATGPQGSSGRSSA
ncbi:hypothetical protein ACWDQO_19550 [Streptomyces sp. NPDC003703]|uniref:hypothetical protein n=1 Tax=Streptomyces sp. NPDC003283 TaxID=3364681 RepID=UPI0036B1D82F